MSVAQECRMLSTLTGDSGWLIGFVSPYMINPDAGDLGAKVGFVFTGFGVPLCFLFWFLIPETLGLEFEDVSHMSPKSRAIEIPDGHDRLTLCLLTRSTLDISKERRPSFIM